MDDVKQIVGDIKKGAIKPIYLLMGDEPYYIDAISDYIEHNVLTQEQKGFNQMTLYGRDVTVEDIVGNAKRYPMMADRQVVIIKEAQDLSRTIEKLVDYAKNPQLTTVLVINYKYKKIDKRKTLYKQIKKVGVVFDSKKLYDNQVPDWIRRVLSGQGYTIAPKASQMLVEFLGTDLSKINNELGKLKIILPPGTQISAEHIEEHIGISKDYNNWELRKAIGTLDSFKAFKIVKYFVENPKDHPMVLTVGILFRFFSELLHYHGLNDKNPRNVAAALKINAYFVSDYATAARNFPMRKVSKIISILREFDLKSKGVDANNASKADLFKELVARILT